MTSTDSIRDELPDRRVRAFVALPCPPGIRDAFAAARKGWIEAPSDVRWADPRRIHVTLRFLGSAAPDRLAALGPRLERTAAAAAPLRFVAGETGAFPGWRRPRVLWLGLAEAEPVIDLAEAVEDDCRAVGFEPETRSFTPHLTLGRVKGPRAAVDGLRTWRPGTRPEMVETMILYRSETLPSGARYTPLATYRLEGGEAG